MGSRCKPRMPWLRKLRAVGTGLLVCVGGGLQQWFHVHSSAGFPPFECYSRCLLVCGCAIFPLQEDPHEVCKTCRVLHNVVRVLYDSLCRTFDS
jgi:hypothetical protein